ncbi:MAG: response regulator transcription factor [Anaerolineales bacterium]|nr:response regulator transcription factor [Anaerolineales bacterium]
MEANILCIEGSYSGSPAFTPALRKKGYQVDLVATGKAALEMLAARVPDVVVINAASMRTSGTRICQAVRGFSEQLPVILICDQGKTVADNEVPCNVILTLPFTVRKLDNRIKPFLPLKSDKVLTAGDIRLDLENHIVRSGEKETRLTPRVADLLALLMRRKGEVLEREELFRQIWETDFTDDTRTLDVHISWLRQAIEAEPRKPKYLKTLRGVGYRLDV